MSHCLYRLKISRAFLPTIFTALFFSIATNHIASAQAGGASISGHISDRTGAIIRDAEVDIRNVDTNVVAKTTTNGAGVYSFPSLQPGKYVLSVHKQGFRSVDAPGLTIYTQDDVERNFALDVGAVAESITVTPTTTNESSAISMTVSREFLEDMPLNGRSFQDLIQLAPGTVSSSNFGSSNGLYSINGQREDSNNFTVDGVSANLGGIANSGNNSLNAGQTLSGSVPAQTALGTTQALASVDDLQEFKIQTSGYAAEFGRSPGGQVQFTTRSGTNELHGTVSEYLRNTIFDANTFTNNYYGDPKSAEHQNDFGGTFGGPLRVPTLYSSGSPTFFFLSYEGLRLLLPSNETEDNATQAFINAASPNVQPFLKAAPLPNEGVINDGCTVTDPATSQLAACDGTFYAGFSYPNNLNNYSARLDKDFGNRFHGFVRYSDTPSYVRNGAEVINQTIVNVHGWTSGLTATLSSNVTDDLRFNYTSDGEQEGQYSAAFDGSTPFNKSLAVPAEYEGPYASAGGSVIIPDSNIYETAFDYYNSGSLQHQYQIVDSLTWSKQKHSVKFGGDWRRLTPTYSSSPYESATNFDTIADVQAGYASNEQISVQASGKPIFDNLSLFVQDHWKVSSKLSLDYGLRWDFNPPPGPSNGEYPVTLTSSDLATANITDDHVQPYPTDRHSFGPRLGFAWNALPAQSHAITVRAGFGIFFDTAQQVIGSAYTGTYPFAANGPLQNEVPLPLSETALAPPAISTALTTPYPFLGALSIPNLTSPYTEQWNLSVDEALNSKNTLTASYVGNSGRKLLFTQYFHDIPTNPNFTFLYLTSNAAQSNYNALQLQDVGRIISGLDIVASFSLAHALDNASTDNSLFPPRYGNSDNDLRRVFNIAANYKSPGLALNRWMHGLTSNWTVANRFSAQSGSPITTIYEARYVTLANGAYGTYEPDLVPGVPIYLHGRSADLNGGSVPGNWRLNRASFACTTNGSTSGACTGTPTRQGTLGRNYLRTPSFWTLNTSLQRSWAIYDRLHLNFRADGFNLFNHPNLASPDVGLSDSTFGELGAYPKTIGSVNALYSMGAARSLQFSFKLQF